MLTTSQKLYFLIKTKLALGIVVRYNVIKNLKPERLISI